MKNTFLKADWKDLIMINYEVSQELLAPYLPNGLELDSYHGKYYISLVGFMFKNTRILGIKFPYHINFEEVNLRFYVTKQTKKEIKRGVVFIKEYVPKIMIAKIANWLYKEPYECVPMSHIINANELNREVSYSWGHENRIKVLTKKHSVEIKDNSIEEFIAEHYWGYTKINEVKTSEYEVTHPKWKIYEVIEAEINVDFKTCYGNSFAFLSVQKPDSIFVAKGSEITVRAKN